MTPTQERLVALGAVFEAATLVDRLARTGQISDEKREEFILASDVLGLSMMVVALNHRTPPGATEAKPDHRMLGIVATMGDAGLFVKMVGPKELVEANTAAFDQFVSSLSLRMPPQ